jgi:hypothetical protein
MAHRSLPLSSPLPAPPTRERFRLDSAVRVRRELARVYADARAGRMPWADATKAAFVLTAIARILGDAELEGRIARLEAETAAAANQERGT